MEVTYHYPTHYTSGKKVALSCLDRVLTKDQPITRYYCPFTGNRLSADTYRLAIENAKQQRYETTDHAPIEVEVDGIRYLYISLDNTVRSDEAGFSLVSSGRLKNICQLVNKIAPDVVFFSEACSKAFDGVNVVYWLEMREIITSLTGMKYCCECANDFDSNHMSLGVAMFAKASSLAQIQSVQACNILRANTQCYGSGAVVVTTKTGKVVVGVHFPLDFKRKGNCNNTGRSLASLIEILNKYDYAIAFGDMNVIPGSTWSSMKSVLEKNPDWTLSPPYYTYIGSFSHHANTNVQQTFAELTGEAIAKLPIPQ